jgi:membrane fusion protein (multidrug efflux system)
MLAAALILSAGLSTVVLTACGNADAAVNDKAGAGEEKNSARSVKVVKAASGDVEEIIVRVATITAPDTINVLSEVDGQITALDAPAGRRVERNDRIAQIDDEELRLAEERAEKILEKAKQDFDRAQAKLERQIATREEYLQAKFAYEQALKDYETASFERKRAKVVAPIAGVIIRRYVSLGDTVSRSTPIATLADLSVLETEILVPQDQIDRVGVGNKVILTSAAGPERTVNGTVKRISPVVESGSGTVRVIVDVPNGRAGIKPGLFVKAKIVTGVNKGVTLVPREAVVIENAMSVLYKVVDGLARRISVEVGNSKGDLVQVVGNVKPGDDIIVVGNNGLNDMTPVRVIPSKP